MLKYYLTIGPIILNLFPKHGICLPLKTGQTQKLGLNELATAKVLGGSELTQEAVVVLENPNEVQILDPENYKTVELLKPKNFKVEGDNVKIFKNQETILLIPNQIK